MDSSYARLVLVHADARPWRRLLLVGAAVAVAAVATTAPGASARLHRHTPLTGTVGGAESIAAGGWHTCALTSGGEVRCWGNNYNGQLGDATRAERHAPVAVFGLQSTVQAITAGRVHTCALTSGGGVECWGWNEFGRLGDGTTKTRDTPVAVSGLQSGVQSIAAGWRHTCAVTSAGMVRCWGWNESGQLGDGTTTARLTPVPVSGLSSGVQALTGGYRHTCALTSGGGVECWGGNAHGQLGDGTTNDHSTPVAVTGLQSGVEAIAAGVEHTCALTSGGVVECWGRNSEGALGDGTADEHLTPVAVSGLEGRIEAIAAGFAHTCALTSGGAVECWGWNLGGELGDGTRTERHRPVVSGLRSGVRAIAAGGFHTCTLSTGGRVHCWGANTFGELGDGTAKMRLKPVPVLGLGIQAAALSVRVRGRGRVNVAGLTCSKACKLERAVGSKVVLTARALRGWAFKRWSGACTGRASRCTFRLRTDTTATAVFVRARPT
jgi:alpha-tubulin suppressor-like RCC1 family protein